jgi:hypothetical protein
VETFAGEYGAGFLFLLKKLLIPLKENGIIFFKDLNHPHSYRVKSSSWRIVFSPAKISVFEICVSLKKTKNLYTCQTKKIQFLSKRDKNPCRKLKTRFLVSIFFSFLFSKDLFDF